MSSNVYVGAYVNCIIHHITIVMTWTGRYHSTFTHRWSEWSDMISMLLKTIAKSVWMVLKSFSDILKVVLTHSKDFSKSRFLQIWWKSAILGRMRSLILKILSPYNLICIETCQVGCQLSPDSFMDLWRHLGPQKLVFYQKIDKNVTGQKVVSKNS